MALDAHIRALHEELTQYNRALGSVINPPLSMLGGAFGQTQIHRSWGNPITRMDNRGQEFVWREGRRDEAARLLGGMDDENNEPAGLTDALLHEPQTGPEADGANDAGKATWEG